jgi:hypothetical protein
MIFAALPLSLALSFSAPASAGVDVGINISLPLPIVFVAPPEVVVIPETYVYVVPDVGDEIYFYNGWWWRPYEGRWFRSRHYDSGWAWYRRVPSFYGRVPPTWRSDYRDRRWQGRPWNHQPIPQQQLQRNWNTWQKSRYWEKQQGWGVQGLKSGAQPQRVQPQRRDAPQESPPRQDRPDRGNEDKRDRK